MNVTAKKLKSARVAVPPDPALIATENGFVLTADMRAQLGVVLAPDVKRLNSIWPYLPTWGLA